jgi:hypothetical protein
MWMCRELLFALLLCFVGKLKASCLPAVPLTLQDIHDGDQKQIESRAQDAFIIRSYPNTSQWEIHGKFDENCAAMIDFNVPGKPGPPPVPLKMTLWSVQSIAVPSAMKLGFEFTDPSATLAPKTQPLNFWISEILSVDTMPRNLPAPVRHLQSSPCIRTPWGKPEVFDDMHDGDMKAITVKSDDLTIEPYGNSQSWVIDSTFDKNCVALVNFDVPGKPNPPPTPLEAAVWSLASAAGMEKPGLFYTEPSENPPLGTPLNVWLRNN